jgi:uncharacterized protein HemX
MPGVTPLRERITRELNTIKGIQQADIAGQSVYLADLANRVINLPLKTAGSTAAETPKAAPEGAKPEAWERLAQDVWKDLRGLVVIRDKALSEPALLFPERRNFLFQNIRLELANARLALLSRDTAGLRASVNTVKAWLNEFFDTQAPAVSTAIASLDGLAKAELSPPMPDLSGLVQDIRQQRAQNAPGAKLGAAETKPK